MEFKTKAALTEWANDQTMAEIPAYYNGLPGVKPVKKFESREVAVTRIWAVLSPGKPKVAQKPRATRKSATSGRKLPKPRKASKAGATVRDEAVKLLSRAGGATLAELMKTFKWQAHSVRGFISVLVTKHGFKIESSKVDGVRTYRIKQVAGPRFKGPVSPSGGPAISLLSVPARSEEPVTYLESVPWMKVLNPASSQWEGRREMFEKKRAVGAACPHIATRLEGFVA